MDNSHPTPPADINPSTTRSDLTRFYSPTVPRIPTPFATILSQYSQIPAAEQQAHVLRVRDRAYTRRPYPCLGRFRFLSLELSTHPLYQTHILPTLKRSADEVDPAQTPVLLDLGTCLGQDLRKLVVDGVDPARLYGSDLDWAYVDAGYDLFRDEHVFPRARFLVPGDVLGDSSDALDVLDGRCDVVNVTAVFHLFDLPEQRRMAGRVARLLRRDGGRRSLLVGAQVGLLEPGVQGTGAERKYRHNTESWRRFWDELFESEEWKGVVLKWEVGGSLNEWSRFRGDAKRDNQDGARTEPAGDADMKVWWHVWWVWVEFR